MNRTSNPIPARRTAETSHRAAGFTLIELMVTVAIVAILAAIAYPNYRNYVIRGQLVDATNGLSTLRADMERYYQDNRSYDAGTATHPCKGQTLHSGNFNITCAITNNAQNILMTASGTGSDLGFTFTVDQTNTMTSIVSGVSGWSNLNCPNTWLSKPGTC